MSVQRKILVSQFADLRRFTFFLDLFTSADLQPLRSGTRQGFLAEALMFETAARHYRDIAKQRKRGS